MGIIDRVEKLRDRPEAQRKRVQLFLSVLITFVVVVFWAFSFGGRVGGVLADGNKESHSPFKVIAESFVGVFRNVREGATLTKDKIVGQSEEDKVREEAELIYIRE